MMAVRPSDNIINKIRHCRHADTQCTFSSWQGASLV